MEAKEAILRIEEHRIIHKLKEPNAFKITEALELATSALEKQIPKKPIGDLNDVPHYRCPNCKCSVKLFDDSSTYPCCHWCGQTLDWGTVNRE